MFYRNTWAEIDLDKFAHNINVIKEYTNKEIFCVVKANAYGHGDFHIATQAMQNGCSYVAVSSLDEAMALRRQGFTKNILILGFVSIGDIKVAIDQKITLTCVSYDWVCELCAHYHDLSDLKLHLKVDTGMNRIGMKKLTELQDALDKLISKNAIVEGIYTHFHSADDVDKIKCERQKKWFYHIIDSLNYNFKWIHASNSDASISFTDEKCNAVRVGLALYGIKSVESNIDLKPILSLYTKITCIKEVKKNETIGYGATYQCNKDEIIATIPIGYGDGFIRANQGRFVCIDGHPYEIVGRVCMDQCMIKVDKKYPVGTKVEIISEYIPISNMAHELKMIPYEVLCLLSDRIPRIYYSNGDVIDTINLRIHE